jgi:two-component system, sporulation sensor kinase E
MNFYGNRGIIKFAVFGTALFISGLSLWYTRQLVNTLADREKKLIDLTAKSYKVIGSGDSNENQSFLFLEIIETNNSIPVILTDEKGQIISSRNIKLPEDLPEREREKILEAELVEMKEQYAPIKIVIPGLTQYVYYRNSDLLMQLKYYPYVQLSVIAVFGLFAYLAFSSSRRAEQNRVWVGMAKETAHQLGTPISGLMAWVELLKTDDKFADEEFVDEIGKDVEKLQMIANRFSNIGSAPQLKEQDVRPIVQDLLDYMGRRISTKIILEFHAPKAPVMASVNRALFEWVLDNLIRNAVDAIPNGQGTITVDLTQVPEGKAQIDVTDTGKGMTKNQFKQIFDPGFTTKTRGWGLGLTLSRRIMEHYHKGKIFVKYSEPGVGTTFRVLV